jgi:acrylyl-CoA reductase (NADPH)
VQDLDLSKLESIAYEISLDESINTAHDLLNGKVRGRVIVDVNK